MAAVLEVPPVPGSSAVAAAAGLSSTELLASLY